MKPKFEVGNIICPMPYYNYNNITRYKILKIDQEHYFFKCISTDVAYITLGKTYLCDIETAHELYKQYTLDYNKIWSNIINE